MHVFNVLNLFSFSRQVFATIATFTCGRNVMQIHKYIIKSLDFVKKFNLIFWVLQIPFYFHCNR